MTHYLYHMRSCHLFSKLEKDILNNTSIYINFFRIFMVKDIYDAKTRNELAADKGAKSISRFRVTHSKSLSAFKMISFNYKLN